ncbi:MULTISPECIES: sodium/glutamate symporter [unclassified Halomonas]|uniref:sodium/glutamate symporter n=1 Tax=unclassified Halomonas TaxID=2609666 RepID=UPI0018657214|nr:MULTISPECIES: sodium/glutamate symporter [unclassified Halomonas]
MPPSIEVHAFLSFTLAILLLFIGKELTQRWSLLRRYSIPEPLVGGALCAAIVCLLYYVFNISIFFELGARDMLLLYFFAAIGLNSQIRSLIKGGRPLMILLVLASSFIVLQNFIGMTIATGFSMDARAGLMVGSISLTGGIGTTMAWTPYFVEELGIANAGELGLAANMIGLIAACLIGGPIAGYLIRKHNTRPSGDAELEIGTLHKDEPLLRLDYHGVLLALFWLNLALMLGQGLTTLIAMSGLMLPDFVGCLLAGIILRSVCDLITHEGKGRLWNWPSMQPGIALISDMSLGMFLTMALMGLQLWELQGVLGFITTALAIQILLTILFVAFVVHRFMGRDYEASVVCAGFGGIVLGSTATAIANMTAVTRQYGAAPNAFIVVPLVCGFFIDLVNALIIGIMAG